MRHRDKRKTVFLHSFWLKKKQELIEHMCVSLDTPNTAWDIVT